MGPMEPNDLTCRVTLTRISGNDRETRDDLVIREATAALRVNGRPFLSLACLPTELEALAAGFLFTEGLATGIDDLTITLEGTAINVQGPVDEEALAAFTQRQVLTTGCGGGFSGADSPGGCRRLDTALRVEDRAIRRLMETMTGAAALFRTTGGTHIACLGDSEGRVLFTAEDIGRHNAVDKVVGLALIAGVGVHDLILCSSGRVSSEILSKAARARIPVVVSRSAPTSRAIELAEGFLLTLVGFARGRRMNVYTAPERVVKDPQD